MLLHLAPEQDEHVFGGQFGAEEHLDHERVAQVGGGDGLARPALELVAAVLCEAVDLAVRAVLLDGDLHIDEAVLFERLERRIDLAELGVPEVLDRRVEELLQLVAGHRLVGQETEEGVLQRHAPSRLVARAAIGAATGCVSVTLPSRPSRCARLRR